MKAEESAHVTVEHIPYVTLAVVNGMIKPVRNPSRPFGLLETDDLAESRIQSALDGARNRDAAQARELLIWIIHALRKFQTLPDEWAAFVADGLERAIRRPEQAGAAFGLVARRKRPLSADKIFRNKEIAMEVHKLYVAGIPLKDSRKGDGAFTRVARSRHVSPKTVERAWSEHIAFVRKFAKALNESRRQ